MRDALGPGTTLGYCTNVHAGTTPGDIEANLERHALAIKQRVSPHEPMGVGLWLPAAAARVLREGGRAQAFGEWLGERGLLPFTLNGFPYGDFHRPVVKHAVYRPDWTTSERLAYTIDLMHVLAALLAAVGPGAGEGSISTLPLGRPADLDAHGSAEKAAVNLRRAAREAAAIEAETGTLIHLDLEPEPGCALDESADVVDFFRGHLLTGEEDDLLRRHLRVCHDICHAAVMFEEQGSAVRRYRAEGIAIGKVQVSAAVRVRFDDMTEPGRRAARGELAAFGEDRYLHQTAIRTAGGATVLRDDLPEALAVDGASAAPTGEWRVHYHVPIFLDRFGHLESTQDEISRCLEALGDDAGVRHFEVETYAWEVLPPSLAGDDLAEGIARELTWLIDPASRGDRS